MVPLGQLRQPQLGSMSTDLNSEFTHFNLVIRVSKVQQLALLFCTFFEMSCRCGCPLRSFVKSILYRVKLCRTFRNFLLHLQLLTWQWHYNMHKDPGRHTTFRCGLFLLMVVWWGQTYCAPNSMELDSCFMPIGARPDHGPGKGITHDL